MDIANVEAKDRKWIDPAIHAGHDRKVLTGDRRKLGIWESGGVGPVAVN
jgi:hypothetical protein